MTECETAAPKIDYLQQQQTMNNILNKTFSIKMDKANTILSDHNLIKYELQKDVSNNLFEALSMSQFFTINYAEEIKSLFINHVKNLIALQQVPKKLSIFKTNLSLFKDYNTNPTFTGFQKINFELASMIFKKKIIIYQIQDESQLLAHFYNNQFESSLQLLKHGLHFDIIYSLEEFEGIEICKNILMDVFNFFFNNNNNFYLQVCENQLNIKYITIQQPDNQQNQQSQQNQSNQQITVPIQLDPPLPKPLPSKNFDQKSPTKHKKSMSDNFNLSNQNESNFNLFSNLKVPEDFLQTLSSVQGNYQDSKKDYFSDLLAIKNFNVSNSKVTTPGNNSSVKFFDYSNNNNNYGSSQNFPPGIADVIPIHENEQQLEQDQDNFQKILNDSFTQNNNNNIFPQEDEIIQQTYDSHQEFNNSNCLSPRSQLGQLESMQTPLQNNINYEFSKNTDNFLFNENLFTKKKLANPVNNNNINDTMQNHLSVSPPPALQQQAFQFVQTPNYFMMQNQIPQQTQPFNFYQQQSYQQQQQQQQQQQYSNRKKGPIIVDESKQRYTGKLKFFDEQKSYGFIVKDDDNSDVFVHFDDLTKAGISQEVIIAIRAGQTIRFEFCCLGYMGKYNRSRKAIELVILSIE